jgi:hypothetical protein
MIMHLPGDQFDHSAAPHPIEAGSQRPPINHLRGQESGRIGAEQNAAELLVTVTEAGADAERSGAVLNHASEKNPYGLCRVVPYRLSPVEDVFTVDLPLPLACTALMALPACCITAAAWMMPG